MIGNFDFSFTSYNGILKLFREAGYSGISYFDAPSPEAKLLLRHDIDIDVFNCERMSEAELENSFSSTWFFQPNNDYYNPLSSKCARVLRDLSEKHTLGLHIDPSEFDTSSQLEYELDRLYNFYSGYFNVKRVFSFHRPAKYLDDPACPVDGFVNAYRKDFSDVMTYVSDSNRRRFFEQDRIDEAYRQRRSVILLTHPLWWRESELDAESLYENMVKRTEINICRNALASNITLYGYLSGEEL